ncbi:MAG: hypothetical protein MUF80_09845, partial [Burkholderiales bacterium]|nr:hypothetical protein [Burkholderiales bacterium]
GVPAWGSVALTECLDWGPTEIMRIGSLHDVDTYRARFRNLVTRGWPWINLQAAGLLRGHLLLVIETPTNELSGAPWTSVNISGPIRRVAEHHYRLESLMDPELLATLPWPA